MFYPELDAMHRCFLSSDRPSKPVVRRTQILVNSHYMIASTGSNVTLQCEVLYVRWRITWWSWEFNGTTIYNQNPSHHLTSLVTFDDGHMTMVLDIFNVSESDSGFYDCNTLHSRWDMRDRITLIVGEKGKFGNAFCAFNKKKGGGGIK